MKPAQRRRHKWIWLFLAIFLPVSGILAYRAMPGKVAVETAGFYVPEASGELQETIETEDYVLRLRTGESHFRQLEMVVRKSLRRPAARLVLKGHNFGEFYVDAGIGAAGVYRWSWTDSVEAAYQLQVWDDIKREVLFQEIIHHQP